MIMTFAQVYFQRVLACESPEGAVLSSYMAAMGCLIMAMPSIIMGAIARAASTLYMPSQFSYCYYQGVICYFRRN